MSHSDNCEAPAAPSLAGATLLQIRAMRPGDVPALVDLWVASWREAMPDIDFEARRPWIAAFLAEPGRDTLVAEALGPLGFATTQGRFLHQLVAAPSAKGQGVATALAVACRRSSPDGLDLSVNQDNPRAIRFYEREGFVRTGSGLNPNSGLPVLHMSWRPSDP